MSETTSGIAVIGSGIIGTLTALTLLQKNHRVTLIERDLDALCCSTGNAGSLSASLVTPVGMPGIWKKVPSMLMDPDGALSIKPSYALQAMPWLLAFLKASQPEAVQKIAAGLHQLSRPAVDSYRNILQKIGALDLLTVTGQLHVYTSEAARDNDAMGWRMRREYGADVQFLNEQELRALEPDVSPRYKQGVYIPTDGIIVNPKRLLHTLRDQFAAAGGRIVQTQVQQIRPHSDKVDLITTQQTSTFNKVVIAAGAWSTQLTQQLGDNLPLQTQRGYHAVIPNPAVNIKRPVVAAEAKVFATPMEMGLRFAGTVEFAKLDSPPTQRRVESLLRNGMSLFPAITEAQAQQHTHWMGNRPCMPDSLPVLDYASSNKNVIYAFGHGHLGVTHAPASVDLVVQLVEGEAAKNQAFSARRFV